MNQALDAHEVPLELLIIAGEVVAVAVTAMVVYLLIALLLGRVALLAPSVTSHYVQMVRGSLRRILVMTAVGLSLGVLVANGWLAANGLSISHFTMDQIASISLADWINVGVAAGKLIAAAVGWLLCIRIARAVLAYCDRAITRWGHLKDSDGSLTAFFLGLDQAIVNTAWLLMLWVACAWFNLPDIVARYVGTAMTIYLVVSIGVLIIRATSVIVETLDGLSRRYAESRDWLHFYDRLRPLVPLFRRCLEAALWIGIASLVVAQLSPIAVFAQYGARLIKVIGIFFVGRVLIETGYLVINRSMLGDHSVSDLERRRRATIIPLFCSIFRYGCYFGMFIVALPVLGQDPTPFLAGVTALSVVVGFGAQSMIADVVSGFFILFENVYLVGDVIEGAGASGHVEAIEFRTTRIRDLDGRLHIVRNGDMKQVINYSKEFAKAIVTIDVPYEADVRRVFAILIDAGAKLKSDNPRSMASPGSAARPSPSAPRHASPLVSTPRSRCTCGSWSRKPWMTAPPCSRPRVWRWCHRSRRCRCHTLHHRLLVSATSAWDRKRHYR
jgi:small conductance mechanosensitive channel